MNEVIKLVASYFILIPIIVVGLLFVRDTKRRFELVRLIILGAGISFVLAKLGSHLYFDPRPFTITHIQPLLAHSSDNGFPSDHTLLAAALGFAALIFSKKLGIFLLGIALLVGVARVAAGVHHVPDIIGSFVAAGLGTFIAYSCIKFYLAKKPQANAKTLER